MSYTDHYADFLQNMEIADFNEIHLVTDILGWNADSLDSILYARTGCRALREYFEEVIVPHDYKRYALEELGLEDLLDSE